MTSFTISTTSVIFAGPTLAGLSEHSLIERSGFELRPPAARGDIRAILDGEHEGPGLIVIVDGCFHQSLALGHAELRRAIDAGWKVWGISSMGAIRAFEMRSLGMCGFGRVFEHFLSDDDFQDDEVALLHSPEPPYVPATEPMVHLRHLMLSLVNHQIIAFDAAQQVVDDLKACWFGERDLDLLHSRVHAIAGPEVGRATREIAGRLLPRCRIKSSDLAAFLERRIWLDASYHPTPRPAPFSRTASTIAS